MPSASFFKKGLDFPESSAIIITLSLFGSEIERMNLTAMEKSPSWSRAHDWKSCRPLKGLEGSNPSFSATESLETVRFQGFSFLRPASVFAAGKPLGGKAAERKRDICF